MKLVLLFLLYPAPFIGGDLIVNYTTLLPCEVNVTCVTPTENFDNSTVNPCEINVACTASGPQEAIQTESPEIEVRERMFLNDQYSRTKSRKPPDLPVGGVLYPRVSESRDLLSLDGIWSFVLDPAAKGMQEEWFQKDIGKMEDAILMPVPSSYNDVSTSRALRDHVGLVWYQRTFRLPSSWKPEVHRVWIRFGGIHYLARVWINEDKVLEHEIGHLPFQGEITKFVNFGKESRITVSVDNRLTSGTIPQGSLEKIETKEGVKLVQKYSYGFFNYAGIHRPVCLYTTPKVYIDDILLKSEFKNGKVFILYTLFYKGVLDKEGVEASIEIIDKNGSKVGSHSQIKINVKNISGAIEIDNPKLWWPYLMNPEPGYLYTVEITVKTLDSGIKDVYRHPFGLRSLKWNNKKLFINDKPIYIRGVSRQEDSDIRGRGFDLVTAVRDHNLLKWLGVNTYRTSHSPHSEEGMDLAEKTGMMVIDEVPSVHTQNYTDDLLTRHKVAVAELINRDKNRACVIMWSVASEATTEIKQAGPYFGSVVSFTRKQDGTRPITAILNRWHTVDQAGQWMDVICFNRFNGYFKEPGRWDIVRLAVENEAQYWNKKYNKPVVMSEFGTETYEGLHSLPETLWSEEFQNKIFSEHFKAFDYLRGKGWFIGEMVYSFTDTETFESTNRVGGKQRKGIFTVQRQPKSCAYFVRKRNFKLAAMMNESSLPCDLELYTASMAVSADNQD